MTTIKETLGLTDTIKFLNSTVISFSLSLGLGSSSESTLTVDLVDDCTSLTGGTAFVPFAQPQLYGVGMPVYFPDNPLLTPNFSFGGILSSWEIKQSSSGLTYSVIVKDPRQLLENTLVIIDSMITGPKHHVNYFNVYAYWEQDIIYSDNCLNYGLSGSNQKGMPYYAIINTLMNEMDIRIFPSTYSSYPYSFKVDFSTFPGIAPGTRTLPQWYRVPGPGISILQILEDICNVLAYEFYVYLERVGGENIIKIGLIDLNNPPNSFAGIINAFAPISTDISYGQEFRNEKSKMVLLGDNVHYLVPTNTFDFFFGQDIYPMPGLPVEMSYKPVVPYGYDDCGFWINKKIDSLNLSLNKPFPSNGPYSISELDIRSAMSSYEMWVARTFDVNTSGTFNAAVRSIFPKGETNIQETLETISLIASSLNITDAVANSVSDSTNNPTPQLAYRNQPEVVEELKKIHGFINNLGTTYYGKQYIARLGNQKVCKKYDPETNTIIYSDTPTNNGGWIDNTYNILGLPEPELTNFRTEDQRIQGFAQFTLSYMPNSVSGVVAANTGAVRQSAFSLLANAPLNDFPNNDPFEPIA